MSIRTVFKSFFLPVMTGVFALIHFVYLLFFTALSLHLSGKNLPVFLGRITGSPSHETLMNVVSAMTNALNNILPDALLIFFYVLTVVFLILLGIQFVFLIINLPMGIFKFHFEQSLNWLDSDFRKYLNYLMMVLFPLVSLSVAYFSGSSSFFATLIELSSLVTISHISLLAFFLFIQLCREQKLEQKISRKVFTFIFMINTLFLSILFFLLAYINILSLVDTNRILLFHLFLVINLFFSITFYRKNARSLFNHAFDN